MHATTGGLLTRRWDSNLTRHRIDPPLVSHHDSGLLLTVGAVPEGALEIVVRAALHFLPPPGSSSTISASTTSSPDPEEVGPPPAAPSPAVAPAAALSL